MNEGHRIASAGRSDKWKKIKEYHTLGWIYVQLKELQGRKGASD